MKNESIDDIFEGIDLNDEELLKKAEKVASFKFKEDIRPIKSSTQISKPESTISSDYFYDLSNQIKMDWDYMPIKKLLVNRHYDRFYDDYLEEKYELKRELFSKINHYRFNEKSYKNFCDIVDTIEDLKDNQLFIGDYLPYKALMEFYLQNGKYKKAIEVIDDFLNSDIYVNEVILSFFKFYSEYLHTKLHIKDTRDFDSYEGSIKNEYPLSEQIFHQRNQYYFISEEKYEFNQSLILLLVKSINAKYLKYEEAIRFYVNLADCDILYFKALAYTMLGFFCDRMHSSQKFYSHYMNALKLKKENGNILEEDFDRIFSCVQIEIDFENGGMESVEDQFNELFSKEFRR